MGKKKPGKKKRKLTSKEKRLRREHKKKYMTIFLNGKQKRVLRPDTIDGLSPDEYIRRNADPIWLMENEMYEYLHELETEENESKYFDWLKPSVEDYSWVDSYYYIDGSWKPLNFHLLRALQPHKLSHNDTLSTLKLFEY